MKQKLKCLDEWDWTTDWRKVLHWKAGQGKKVKRRLNKRFRREINEI